MLVYRISTINFKSPWIIDVEYFITDEDKPNDSDSKSNNFKIVGSYSMSIPLERIPDEEIRNDFINLCYKNIKFFKKYLPVLEDEKISHKITSKKAKYALRGKKVEIKDLDQGSF